MKEVEELGLPKPSGVLHSLKNLLDLEGERAEAERLAQVEATAAEVEPHPRMPSSVPRAPSRVFTGRERELAELTSQLGGAGVLISGLGGMGKSALARALVQAVAPRYPDLRIVVDLQGTSEDPLAPAAAMAHVVRAFLPDVPLPSSLEALTGLYRAVLQGQRALILFEDAQDRAQVEPLLPPAGSAIVVTSRRRFALPGVHVLSLDRLETAAAVAMLRCWAPSLDAAVAEGLAELCGGVPLALRLLCGALHSRPDLTIEAYVEQLRDAQSRHALLDASLQVSFGLLDPILQIVWSRLGLFTTRFHRRAVSVTTALSLGEEIDTLVEHGMVEHDPETGFYGLPRSARSLAKSLLTEADSVAVQRFMHFMEVERRPRGQSPVRSLQAMERLLGAARRAGYRPAEALYLERTADSARTLQQACELREQALAIHRELGDRSAEDRVSSRLASDKWRLAQQEQARRSAAGWRETRHLAAEAHRRRAVELSEKLGASLRARPGEPATALEKALALLCEGSRVEKARSAYQISVHCRSHGDLDHAIMALELCIDIVDALGWGPATAEAALGRSPAESLADELARLRASRTK